MTLRPPTVLLPLLAVTLSLLIALCHPSSATAYAANITLKIKNDKRRVIDFGVFSYGGANDGIMDIKVMDFLIHDLDEYDSVDEPIGFALDLVPSAAFARKQRSKAIKKTKLEQSDGKKRSGGGGSSNSDEVVDSGATVVSSSSSTSARGNTVNPNICFVDDSQFLPETRYLLPLQDSLARIGRRVERNTPATATKVEKATALRALAKNLSATIAVRPDRPGYYALYFYNCKKSNRNKTPVPVTFKIRMTQFNIIGDTIDTQYQSYLGYGDTRLPELFLFAFILFGVLATLWHIVLFGGGLGGILGDSNGNNGSSSSDSPQKKRGGSSGGGSHRKKAVDDYNNTLPQQTPPKLIHKLMYALLILKCASLFFEAVMLNKRRSTGKLSAAVDFVFYAFHAVKGFFLFTIILLLGSGWSLLKPFLSGRDRKLLLLLLPLQLIINVALAVISESSEGSKYWAWWRDTLRIVDLLCCFAVVLPVVTSIRTLSNSTEREDQRRLDRLRQFRTFYLVVIAYMFVTRVVLDYISTIAPYNLTWVAPAVGELGAFCLYVVAGYMFRPAAEEGGGSKGDDHRHDRSEDSPKTTITKGSNHQQQVVVQEGDADEDEEYYDDGAEEMHAVDIEQQQLGGNNQHHNGSKSKAPTTGAKRGGSSSALRRSGGVPASGSKGIPKRR